MQPLKLGGGDHKTGFTPLVGFQISIGSVQKRHLISSKPIGWDFQSSPKVGLMLTCKARITSRLCIFHSHSWPIISGLGRERERERKRKKRIAAASLEKGAEEELQRSESEAANCNLPANFIRRLHGTHFDSRRLVCRVL